jgi:hypothetical protein
MLIPDDEVTRDVCYSEAQLPPPLLNGQHVDRGLSVIIIYVACLPLT